MNNFKVIDKCIYGNITMHDWVNYYNRLADYMSKCKSYDELKKLKVSLQYLDTHKNMFDNCFLSDIHTLHEYYHQECNKFVITCEYYEGASYMLERQA